MVRWIGNFINYIKVPAASNFRSSIFVQITFNGIFHNPNTENSLKIFFEKIRNMVTL